MVEGFTKPALTRDGKLFKCNLYFQGAEDIIENINERISKHETVIFLKDSHDPKIPEMGFPSHCTVGSREDRLDDRLKRSKNNVEVFKSTIDCFASGRFKDIITNLVPENGEIEVCGICTDLCTDFTVKGLAIRGYKVSVKEDCVAGLDAEISKATITAWKKYFGVNVF